ncbi:Uu.00g084150.m01.CDS01 [Anthostomella pinea]|uniref:guanylate kinase n=1 Tax=Anthostomella pinea TaxID=933095 RepID=A0AAI8YH98_9PEZI|nr:Uu.00g084150.m01.CDS01 [Anthostomella pinea]
MDKPTDRRPIVIAGPSGVGKGTLWTMLRDRHPNTFSLSISHTTRAPRTGEVRGVHYHYVTREEFKQLIDQDAFIEHAEFGGNLYGTSREATRPAVNKDDKIIVLDIDIEGVKQVKESHFNARYVFIKPPSTPSEKADEPEEDRMRRTLEKRLRGRASESEEQIKKRLDRALSEITYGIALDDGKYKHFDTVIENNELETAFKNLESWVYGPKEESTTAQ